MISYFRIMNFRSIIDTVLDLRFGEGKAPNGYKGMDTFAFLSTGTRERVIPVQALYGANASGKTNIIRAIRVLQQIILGNEGIKGKFQPNKIASKQATTCFELSFYAHHQSFRYKLEYDKTHIVHEALELVGENAMTLFDVQNGSVDAMHIATELYTPAKLTEIFRVECANSNGLQQVPFISKLATHYPGLDKRISEAYAFFNRSLFVFTKNSFLLSDGIDALTENDNDQTAVDFVIDRITRLIQKLDIGIQQIVVERTTCPNEEINLQVSEKFPVYAKREDGTNDQDRIRTRHIDSNGEDVWFNFNEESAGTQLVAGLLCILLKGLDDGSVIFVDELDNSLHSFVFREMVRLFKDKRYNKKNAQIVFTAHNTDVLEDRNMRVSEVGIVSKTMSDGTTIMRLSDFKGIRNVIDFRKQYLAGAFSGIPFPYV